MSTPPLATSLTNTIADAFGFTTPEREYLDGLIREGLGEEKAIPVNARKLAELFMDAQIKPGVTNLELAKIGSRMAFELTRLPPAPVPSLTVAEGGTLRQLEHDIVGQLEKKRHAVCIGTQKYTFCLEAEILVQETFSLAIKRTIQGGQANG